MRIIENIFLYFFCVFHPAFLIMIARESVVNGKTLDAYLAEDNKKTFSEYRAETRELKRERSRLKRALKAQERRCAK